MNFNIYKILLKFWGCFLVHSMMLMMEFARILKTTNYLLVGFFQLNTECFKEVLWSHTQEKKLKLYLMEHQCQLLNTGQLVSSCDGVCMCLTSFHAFFLWHGRLIKPIMITMANNCHNYYCRQHKEGRQIL